MAKWTLADYEAYKARLKGSQGPMDAKSKPELHCAFCTDELKLNRTEKAYLEFLRAQGAVYQWIGVQNVTLKLADDVRFTVDFVVLTAQGELEGHEVKGFWRDDAKVKIKVAARMFPWISFVVIERLKGGWQRSPVHP